jgi:predicted nucleotidyltransferase
MKASPEQLVALRTVARRLGALRERVVFVGGMASGLLVTDPGAPMARPTDDVDLIVEIASTGEYQTSLREKLVANGFHEDSREGAPICRWLLDDTLRVDVMPTDAKVLGFSNGWYSHAIKTAKVIDLPPDDQGPVSINVIAAPAFCATKLAAWASRGKGDLLHHDLEDLVALVDGRAELLGELESDAPALRKFVADSLQSLFAKGLEDQLPGHLQGDQASQARLPFVLTTLRRMARYPTVLNVGERVAAGDPGVTGVPPGSSWDWEIVSVEKALASKPATGSSHVAIVARLTSHSLTAGTTGDGRDVFVEDSMGRRFRPLYKLLHAERARRRMPDPHDQILPHEPFDTVWVYELPANAKVLRLLLPSSNYEMPFERPGG